MNKLSTAWSAQRVNKYRNQPCVIDGHRFASKAEGRRYQKLRLLENSSFATKACKAVSCLKSNHTLLDKYGSLSPSKCIK